MRALHRFFAFGRQAKRPLMALAISASLFSATACDSPVDPAGSPATAAPAAGLQSRSALAKRPQPPKMEFKTPAYPAIALHIVYREYVNKHPGIRYLDPEDKEYQRYMEKRLRELYPQRGYAGMMKAAVEEMRRNKAAWRKYEEEMQEYIRSRAIPLPSFARTVRSRAGLSRMRVGTGSRSTRRSRTATSPRSRRRLTACR